MEKYMDGLLALCFIGGLAMSVVVYMECVIKPRRIQTEISVIETDMKPDVVVEKPKISFETKLPCATQRLDTIALHS